MTNDRTTPIPAQALTSAMSETDFASWGLPELAFVKPVLVANPLSGQLTQGWAIHAADGTHMGLAPSRELAFAAIKQHELEPVSVH